MSSYSDFANAAARIEEAKGNALAEGARQNGAIWGGALGNLGSLITQYPLQQAQIAEAKQRQQLGALQLQQAQQAQQANQILDAAYSKAFKPDGSFDETVLQQGLANTSAAHLWPDIHKKLMDAQKAGADLAKTTAEVAEKEREHMAALANAADTSPDPNDKAATLVMGLADGVKSGAVPKEHAASVIQQILGPDGNPDAAKVTAQIARMKVLSAADVEKRAQAASAAAATAKNQAELPGVQADAAVKQQVAAGTVGGITPEQQAQNKSTDALRGIEKGNLDVARQRLGIERQREAREGSMGVGIDIKPDSREYRIAQDLAYGKLTFADFNRIYGRAMGNAAVKAGIYDTARQLNPNFDPAQFEIGFKMAVNPQIRQRVIAIDALGPVIDKIEALSAKVGNGDVQMFNRLLQGAKLQVSNKPVANFNQLKTLLGDEAGIALGVGTGSDLKTKLGLDLVNTNLSDGTFQSNMEQLRSIMQSRKQLLLGTMGPYSGAAQPTPQAGTGAPPPGAKVRAYNPATGKFE